MGDNLEALLGPDTCRLCLKSGRSPTPVSNENLEGSLMAIKIDILTSVKVAPSDKVCPMCRINVKNFYDFRIMCVQSDARVKGFAAKLAHAAQENLSVIKADQVVRSYKRVRRTTGELDKLTVETARNAGDAIQNTMDLYKSTAELFKSKAESVSSSGLFKLKTKSGPMRPADLFKGIKRPLIFARNFSGSTNLSEKLLKTADDPLNINSRDTTNVQFLAADDPLLSSEDPLMETDESTEDPLSSNAGSTPPPLVPISSSNPLKTVRFPLSSIRDPLSSIRDPLSSIRDPLSSIRDPLSSIRDPLSSIRDPLSSATYPLSASADPLSSELDPPSVEETSNITVEPLSPARKDGEDPFEDSGYLPGEPIVKIEHSLDDESISDTQSIHNNNVESYDESETESDANCTKDEDTNSEVKDTIFEEKDTNSDVKFTIPEVKDPNSEVKDTHSEVKDTNSEVTDANSEAPMLTEIKKELPDFESPEDSENGQEQLHLHIDELIIKPEELIIPEMKRGPEELIIPEMKRGPEELIIPEIKGEPEDQEMFLENDYDDADHYSEETPSFSGESASKIREEQKQQRIDTESLEVLVDPLMIMDEDHDSQMESKLNRLSPVLGNGARDMPNGKLSLPPLNGSRSDKQRGLDFVKKLLGQNKTVGGQSAGGQSAGGEVVEKPFRCASCDLSFAYYKSYIKHKDRHLGILSTHPCTLCPAIFSTNRELHFHMRKHAEKSFSCDRCYRSFPSKDRLQAHYTMHTGDKPHTCDVCLKTFAYKSSVILHMKKIHGEMITGGSFLRCPKCPTEWNTPQELKQHMEIHVPEETERSSFSCPICAMTFPSKSILNVHARIHQKSK